MKQLVFISFLFLAACMQDKRVGGIGDTTIKNRADVNSSIDGTAAGDPEISASVITCNGIGLVKLSDSMTDLERKIGKSNLTQDSLMLEGMFNGFVTTLWKGAKNELTVYWNEDRPPYKTIKFLKIFNPLAPDRFANGVGIGTTLKELVKLNGGTPISLYGFGWIMAVRFKTLRGSGLSMKSLVLVEFFSCPK